MTRALRFLVLVLLVLTGGATSAQQFGPIARGRDGQLSVTAALMPITNDAFNKLWETPRTENVDLPTRESVEPGDPLMYVLFFRKSKPGAELSLYCDIFFVHPDGTMQTALKDSCGPRARPGPAVDWYIVTRFGFEAPDIHGESLVVMATLTDRIDGESVSLATAIGIGKRKGASP